MHVNSNSNSNFLSSCCMLDTVLDSLHISNSFHNLKGWYYGNGMILWYDNQYHFTVEKTEVYKVTYSRTVPSGFFLNQKTRIFFTTQGKNSAKLYFYKCTCTNYAYYTTILAKETKMTDMQNTAESSRHFDTFSNLVQISLWGSRQVVKGQWRICEVSF